jgi:hypothetical protein
MPSNLAENINIPTTFAIRLAKLLGLPVVGSVPKVTAQEGVPTAPQSFCQFKLFGVCIARNNSGE